MTNPAPHPIAFTWWIANFGKCFEHPLEPVQFLLERQKLLPCIVIYLRRRPLRAGLKDGS